MDCFYWGSRTQLGLSLWVGGGVRRYYEELLSCLLNTEVGHARSWATQHGCAPPVKVIHEVWLRWSSGAGPVRTHLVLLRALNATSASLGSLLTTSETLKLNITYKTYWLSTRPLGWKCCLQSHLLHESHVSSSRNNVTCDINTDSMKTKQYISVRTWQTLTVRESPTLGVRSV